MLLSNQELCQILEKHIGVLCNSNDLKGIQNYILKSEWFKKYNAEYKSIDAKRLSTLEQVIDLLKLNFPVQYAINESDFMGLILYVDTSVLIPRPETEELTNWVIQEFRNQSDLKVLDVGCGSGCIAIYLKKRNPNWKVTGLDVSSKALKVAKLNASGLNVEIDFVLIDFLEVKEFANQDFDIIVSNPPYISRQESHLMSKHTLAFEPDIALFPKGNDPLIFYRKLAEFGHGHLNPKGKIFCEINEFLASETEEIFKFYGYVSIQIRSDMQGKPRMLKAEIN